MSLYDFGLMFAISWDEGFVDDLVKPKKEEDLLRGSRLETVRQELMGLPPSRVALFGTLNFLVDLPPEDLVSYLCNQDPKISNPFPAAVRLFATKTGIHLSTDARKHFSTPEGTWSYFVESLRKADRSSISASLSPKSEDGLKEDHMSDEDLRRAATTFGKLKFTADRDDGRMYWVPRHLPGRDVDTNVFFEQILGEWKISITFDEIPLQLSPS